MNFHRTKKSKLCIAGFVGLALVAAPLTTATATAAGETVDINLLNINDFHGRIDANTVKFAGTIESLRATAGAENTLFLSDGDNIGASLFASSSQDDQPTIDVLNTLDLKSSAVGNHEFDRGFDDLTGRVDDAANFSYLGANVYEKGTETPALQEYDIFEVAGVRVAVIGAVTEETPTLVSPGGVATLDFGNPVEAVNRVVAELKEDDLADVFVAEYHEGASAGTPDGATLEEELELTDSAFAEIVTETSADVDAIFTGHTHKQYAWDAPVPGVSGATRPVLQTGNYGENIGQIVLTVDVDTDEVTTYTAKNVARVTTADSALVEAYPAVAEVKTIVDAALAEAAVIGNKPIGEVTKDITTAFGGGTRGEDGIYTGGTRDDRANESTLGNLVADSILDSLAPANLGGADIAVVNAGGLRQELLYAGSSVGEGNGVVTYAEANAVLPFVNNLWTTSLTGAQFKTALEQQWQLDANGNVPSRPILNLAVSKNVSFTYDASLAQGNRITSIFVNGEPIDPAKTYRIGSFNFLLQGGDNFRVFAQGTNTRDSGLIDRDAWISYLTKNSPLTPSYARRGVAVTGAPTSALDAGFSGTVSLSKLDLTSLGSPANTTVSAYFEGSDAPAVKSKVTNGAATATYVVPRGLDENATLIVRANASGTIVRIPVTVNPDPVITGSIPTVEGGREVGDTLTATIGEWSPSSTETSVQWLRNGVAISGATGLTYTLVKADALANITVAVTGSAADLPDVTKQSAPVKVFGLLVTTTSPKITGTPKVGSKLTAVVSAWKPGLVKFKAQWNRNGVPISGATKSTYVATSADKGKKITVTLVGTKSGYSAVTKTSKAVTVK